MSERYVSCNIRGGLGNQLFQIFATLAYGMRTGRQPRFCLMDRIGNRSSYWHSFLRGLEPFQINQNDFVYLFHYSGNTRTHQEPHYAYSEIPEYPNVENILLDGYFQSRTYFAGYEKQILELLWGNKGNLGRIIGDSTIPRIGMHFRIGDYKNIQHCHPVMATSYYVKALTQCLKEHGFYLDASYWNDAVEKMGNSKEIRKLVEVIYLCEDSDIMEVENHLNILRDIFPYLSFHRGLVDIEFEKGEQLCDRDWKEMALLSGCDWFVIPNSTFSWWAATFSSLLTRYSVRKGGMETSEIERGENWVYYPSIWFGPALVSINEVKDLLNQPGWKEI
jgi:hypothetical protein